MGTSGLSNPRSRLGGAHSGKCHTCSFGKSTAPAEETTMAAQAGKPPMLILGPTGAIGTISPIVNTDPVTGYLNILALAAWIERLCEVVRCLLAMDVKFCVGVPSLAKADLKLRDNPNITLVEFDLIFGQKYYSPKVIAKALVGIQKLFLVTAPGQTISAGEPVIAAAAAAKLKHLVKLSAWASDDPRFYWGREHYQLEQYIIAKKIPYTFLRATSLFTNAFADADTIKTEKQVYRALAPTSRVNYVANSDVAEIIATVLTLPGHENKAYDLAGPDTMNTREYCAKIASAVGFPIEPVFIDDAQLRARSTWMPASAMDGWSNIWAFFKLNGYDPEDPSSAKYQSMTETLLAHPPLRFSDWLLTVKDSFVAK